MIAAGLVSIRRAPAGLTSMPNFGVDDPAIALAANRFADAALALACSVDRRRVDAVDAEVAAGADQGHGVIGAGIGKPVGEAVDDDRSAELPGADSDRRNAQAGAAKGSVLHLGSRYAVDRSNAIELG